ncbi:MAG: AAA family ATPase [Oscillospiraceae bacterium]|nr:AAA family ATPase [Oscillospiraceae bacterium]
MASLRRVNYIFGGDLMGTYLDPGNTGFKSFPAADYTDRSGLIALINDTIDTKQRVTCICRPQGFGKTLSAQMLCAYYDCTCDSDGLFKGLAAASEESYGKYLNSCHVVYIDMVSLKAATHNYYDVVRFLTKELCSEISAAFSVDGTENDISSLMKNVIQKSDMKLILIIDEWDAPVRETHLLQKEYIEFLRHLMTGHDGTPFFSAVYMTGIIPFKRIGSEHALDGLKEYTMTDPGKAADIMCFTENDVKVLCDKSGTDIDEVRDTCAGYLPSDKASYYSPSQVMRKIKNKGANYTFNVSALIELINYDIDGLIRAVTVLTGGGEVSVDTSRFLNDSDNIRNKNDILLLLVHFGYLAYDPTTKTARIPNSYIEGIFLRAIRRTPNKEAIRRVMESQKLLDDILDMNEEAVAQQIEKIQDENPGISSYSENALHNVVKQALFSARSVFDLQDSSCSEDGRSDIAYIPKPNMPMPAIFIELRDDKEKALDKSYPEEMSSYADNMIIIAIDRDITSDKRMRICKINPCDK